jgi:alpha,alpha-trehalase
VLVRSDRTRSWRLFKEALESDVSDIQGGTTPEGIHLGAMAGVMDLIHRAYTGMETREDVLWFNPGLPEELETLRMQLHYRGHSLETKITQKKLKVSALRCMQHPIKVGFKGTVVDLSEGATREFEL